MLHSMPVYKTKNENFFKTWTPEMAYVLGFFTADGYMIHTKRGGYYVCFEITDYEVLSKIKNALAPNNKISERNRPFPWKKLYRLQIGSRVMYEDLSSLGFHDGKSLTIRFPQVPNIYLRDFIRGYFDGDGCVHFGNYQRKNRRDRKLQLSIHFTSGSKIFLEELWKKLKPIIKGGHISEKERGYELVFGQHDSIALFHFMYDNSSELFLERKYEKFRFAFKELNMRA